MPQAIPSFGVACIFDRFCKGELPALHDPDLFILVRPHQVTV
ncbi:hypothetical protein [Acetobacter cerevisiae]|nr:hypothetical protein [Acetobacter cerevisiae]